MEVVPGVHVGEGTRGGRADLLAAAVSLRRLGAIGARVLAPGHGRPWVDGRLPTGRPR